MKRVLDIDIDGDEIHSNFKKKLRESFDGLLDNSELETVETVVSRKEDEDPFTAHSDTSDTEIFTTKLDHVNHRRLESVPAKVKKPKSKNNV